MGSINQPRVGTRLESGWGIAQGKGEDQTTRAVNCVKQTRLVETRAPSSSNACRASEIET